MKSDFSKKPVGATHMAEDQRCYSTGGIQYYRQTGSEWSYWAETIGFGWVRCFAPCKPVSPVEETKTKEWTGEGLPPVGTVCEYIDCSKITRTVEVLAYSKDEAWVRSIGKECAIHSFITKYLDKFRPIRTPEQIAAEQYERDAEELAKILAIHEPIEVLALAKLVLDCGYSKQVTE